MVSEWLVSIVMPAFNTSKFIKKAIQSIIDQKYTNWELLICDDASTDSTLDFILSFSDSRIKVTRNSTNLGYLKTTNSLLSSCTGDFITFQDSDDLSHPHRIYFQLQAFKKDRNLGICGTNGTRINQHDAFINTIEKPQSHTEIMELMKVRNPFIGSSLMITKQVYQLIGGYREYFDDFAYQDYDWAWLIAERFKAVNLPGQYYHYRQHSSSNSKKVSLKRRISLGLVQHLAKQRLQTGTDDVFDHNNDKLKSLLQLLEKPYRQNPSKLYVDFATDFVYVKLYRKAIHMALLAVWNKPMGFQEHKLLLYIIWHSIIR